MLSLRGIDSIEQALLLIAQGLAAARGIEDIDWPARERDRDALLAAVIDLAEGDSRGRARRTARPWWVVLDDLHCAAPVEVASALEGLSRYARRSRWFAMGRSRLDLPELRGQVLQVDGMEVESLRQLAAAAGADIVSAGGVATQSGGSPWRLLQLLAGGRAALEPSGELGDLPADARPLLEALSLLTVEFPESVLARMAQMPSHESLDALLRRGFVERSPGGMRLHEVARAALGSSAPEGKREAITCVLASEGDPTAQVEALRLFVGSGKIREARQLLEECGEELLGAGLLRQLWRAIAACDAPGLDRWRLRTAVALGDAELAAQTRLPTDADTVDHLRFAESLFIQGRFAESLAQAAHVAECSLEQRARLFAVRHLTARCLLYLGRVDDALTVIERLSPCHGEQRLTMLVERSKLLVEAGRRPEAEAALFELEAAAGSVATAMTDEVRFGIAWIAYRLGDIRRARRALKSIAEPAEHHYVYDSARRAFCRAAVAFDAGDATACSSLIDRLEQLGHIARAQLPCARLMRLQLRFERGELEGLATAVAELSATGDVGVRTAAQALAARIAIVCSEPGVDVREDASAVGSFSDLLNLTTGLLAIHRGGQVPQALCEPRDHAHPELRALAYLLHSRVQLVGRHPDEAVKAARHALVEASTHGYRLVEIRVRDALCDALLCAGLEVESEAREFGRLAAELGLPRRRVEARLWEMIASRTVLDPVVLAATASDQRASPVARRRARALLGEAGQLDAIDRAVVEAVTGRAPVRLMTVIDAEREPGWGLDLLTRKVWRDQAWVDFSKRAVQWKVLETIARSGGAASKEDIVKSVWGELDLNTCGADQTTGLDRSVCLPDPSCYPDITSCIGNLPPF